MLDQPVLPTIAYAVDGTELSAQDRIRSERQPALPGFIWRKLIAAGITDFTSREASVACCMAEMDWAYADWQRIVLGKGLSINDAIEAYGIPTWQLVLLPHEAAAQTVVNAASIHLNPIEDRARQCWRRLQGQRRAGWDDRAKGTASDLRWYLHERSKTRIVLRRAIAIYARLRDVINRPPSAPSCARAV